MITGLPSYREPIEQSLRCVCGHRYLVYLGVGIGEAESRARERAEQIGAQFIDARDTPFMKCECGEFLDFTEDVAARVMWSDGNFCRSRNATPEQMQATGFC